MGYPERIEISKNYRGHFFCLFPCTAVTAFTPTERVGTIQTDVVTGESFQQTNTNRKPHRVDTKSPSLSASYIKRSSINYRGKAYGERWMKQQKKDKIVLTLGTWVAAARIWWNLYTDDYPCMIYSNDLLTWYRWIMFSMVWTIYSAAFPMPSIILIATKTGGRRLQSRGQAPDSGIIYAL